MIVILSFISYTYTDTDTNFNFDYIYLNINIYIYIIKITINKNMLIYLNNIYIRLIIVILDQLKLIKYTLTYRRTLSSSQGLKDIHGVQYTYTIPTATAVYFHHNVSIHAYMKRKSLLGRAWTQKAPGMGPLDGFGWT